MLRIEQLKLLPDHSVQDLRNAVIKSLRISHGELQSLTIRKQSLDARKKPDLKYVYTVDVAISDEAKFLKKNHNPKITKVTEKTYTFPAPGSEDLKQRPVIVGSGPAGLFCAYFLAQNGYNPLVIERGKPVEEREKDIREFWEKGILKTNSNVQFGEGGAGTFSDGKLNTMVKDPAGRNRKVLESFVQNGAPETILYENKPHIGTDLLIQVVRNMREQIKAWGGEFRFQTAFVDFSLRVDDDTKEKQLFDITVISEGKKEVIPAQLLVLAIGHSARDTFAMLYEKEIPMLPKAFAVGVRAEHLQQTINDSQYGKDCPYKLPAAAYKLTANLENGRGVYSFCMCPGGYVVNASSEEGHLAVNGMSYHARDGANANSAIVVTVSPEDYGDDHPLAGLAFQRKLEKRAYELGSGKIPVQRFEDFCVGKVSTSFGKVKPSMKGEYTFADVRSIFPDEVGNALEEGIRLFEKKIQGFAHKDTLLSGVESRTSSPVRITRNEELQVENTGIYPCGEGAGYAGGITSAAMDGMKVAEKIGEKYRPIFPIHQA